MQQYRSSIAGSCATNSKNRILKIRNFWRQKNQNIINYFLPHFVTSKLFKVIFTDFFAKNEN
jgi:hypothetical protein